jgi:cyclophilin family peptidyl-prolyl cis-trans isomerase
MRNKFFIYGIPLTVIFILLYFFQIIGPFIPLIFIVLLAIGFIDSSQTKHTILRNFPLIGHFRYIFETISPEIQQYFIERSTDGKPFSRNERSLIYQRSKNVDSSAMLGNGDVGYKIPAEIVNGIWHKRGALAAARDNNPEKASSGCQFYIVDGQKFKREDLANTMNQKNLNRKQKIFYDIIQKDSINATINAFQTAKDKEGLTNYIETLKPSVEEEYQKTGGDFIYDEPQVETYETVGGAPHLDGDYTVFGELIEGFDVLAFFAKSSILNS